MAEDLARRSGMSLNEWVSRLMADGPEDATSQDYFSQPASPRGAYVETPRESSPRFEAATHPVDEIGRVTGAIERLSERMAVAENRQALAIAGIERSVREVITRIDSAEREQMQVAARVEGDVQEARTEASRLAERMDSVAREQAQVAARIEAAGRVGDDVQAAKAEGLRLAERMDSVAREQVQVAARFEGEVQEARNETIRLADRLRQIEDEAAGPRSAEAIRAIEGALGKVAGHVYEGEKRSRESIGELIGKVERLGAAELATHEAIQGLKSTCSLLDDRLSLAERAPGDSIERAAANLEARVEAAREELTAHVAATREELTSHVETTRQELSAHGDSTRGQLSQQLAAATDARFERFEQALLRMTDHVKTSEQRQAGALERMGREVLEVAQSLNRKVQAVERTSNEAADRIGAEVSRFASAAEDRFARADSIQAQALEKLGGEIARITERLAERIGNAERRSAQAIDDVGEQVARITERVSQRQERTTTELAERIRQSEERTARLLEEARAKIDERLSETNRRLAEPPRAAALDDGDDALFGDAPFPGFETPPAERDFVRAGDRAVAAHAEPSVFETTVFDDTDFEAAARFDTPPLTPSPVLAPPAPRALTPPPGHEPELDDVELEPNVGFDVDDELLGPGAEPYAAPQPRPALPTEAPRADAPPPAADDAPNSALTTREVIERARAAARAASDRDGPRQRQQAAAQAQPRPADDSVVQNLTFGRSRKRNGGGNMTGALMVASLMAAIGLSASGYVFLQLKPADKSPRHADGLSVATDGAQPSTSADAPMAAVALSPQPASTGPDMTGPYTAAVTKITANDHGGVADLHKLADAGYAPAQFYLAELYQDGRAGVRQDAAEARKWLEKAAEGGDRTAMHNLALDMHEGIGGPKNAASAAEWFRRAAELGLLDSQFNLAAIYEHGDGVSQNNAEAYKWYLIASRSGDAGARDGALRVRAALSPDERSVAERAAADFQPSAPNPSTVADAAPAGAPPAAQPDLVTAQRALNQLGYYQGPTDGAASPALHLAIEAYQRDQSLPVSGNPDAATLGKLQAYTQ
ncbi:MAG TPA: peptidoglycan-binding protein [Caulobacteraceae bacterium]|nr:peptidoglycan-binding protein [Caulobacteraceae bacterium]